MYLSLKFVKLWLLICRKYLRRHLKVVFLLSGLLVSFLFLQFKFGLFIDTNSIRIGMIGTYQEHDIPHEVLHLVSKSLVEDDKDGKSKPAMVSGWEVNNDATIFKFKLKRDLKWVDNTNILAKDLIFNIPDVEVSIQEDYILQLKLKDSYSPLPSLLTKPVFKKGTNLGTGPYKIKKIEKSKIFITKITLTPTRPAVPAGRQAGGSKDPKLPTVYIRFYPNEKVAKTGFSVGEVQVLMGLSDTSFASQNPKVKMIQKNDYGRIVTILYFTKDSLLSNRSLRQALGFQAPEISGFEVAQGPYPKTSWAFDPNSKKYLNNPKEAVSALERAKQALDETNLKRELTITTTPNLEEVAKKIVAAWKELGFEVKIRVESGIPQNFQILLITQSIPSDPDQYFLWHSTQEKTNLSKYQSARVDKDLEDGRKTSNQEERKEKYLDFQKTLLEDAPTTYLYFPKYNIIYLKKAENNLNKLLSLQFPNSE